MIQNLSLGFLKDIARSGENLLEVINEKKLDKKQSKNFKSLDVSLFKKSSAFYLSRLTYYAGSGSANKNSAPVQLVSTISNLIENFSNLKYLSIDFVDLTNDLL